MNLTGNSADTDHVNQEGYTMPDVKVWLEAELFSYTSSRALALHLRPSVATAMSFEVWDQVGHADNSMLVTPDEIDITQVSEIACFNGKTMAIVEIAAYDYPERMSDIGDRLEQIGQGFKQWLDVPEEMEVSLTFIPIPIGCWASV